MPDGAPSGSLLANVVLHKTASDAAAEEEARKEAEADRLFCRTASGLNGLSDQVVHDIANGPPVSAEIEAMGLPPRLLADLWMVWCVIDTDHNNLLSPDELAQSLAAFGHHLDQFEVEDMLREVSKGGREGEEHTRYLLHSYTTPCVFRVCLCMVLFVCTAFEGCVGGLSLADLRYVLCYGVFALGVCLDLVV